MSYSPNELWERFGAYKQEIKDNPLGVETISAGKVFKLKKRRPLTKIGFCKFANISFKTFCKYRDRDKFIHIYARVCEEIEADQIEGAMVGIYAPAITARVLGLKEQADITSNGEKINPPQQPTSIIAYYNDKRLELTGDDIDGRDDDG